MNMYCNLLTEQDPRVSLINAKAFIKVEDSFDDLIISRLIKSCTRFGELYCGKSFREQEWVCYDLQVTSGCVVIPKSVVSSVIDVSYDNGGDTVIISPSDYKLNRSKQISSMAFTSNIETSLVNVKVRCDLPVEYQDLSDQGVLHHVAFLYENRGDTVSVGDLSAPLESISIYDKFKTVNV